MSAAISGAGQIWNGSDDHYETAAYAFTANLRMGKYCSRFFCFSVLADFSFTVSARRSARVFLIRRSVGLYLRLR